MGGSIKSTSSATRVFNRYGAEARQFTRTLLSEVMGYANGFAVRVQVGSAGDTGYQIR